MQTEIEAKFLNINMDKMRLRLRELGATQVHPERVMRRRNYDFPDKRLQAIGGWVRVRDEGDKITMSYKQLQDRSLRGTKEVNLTIDSMESAHILLLAIGLEAKAYQETRREKWSLDECEITLDTWPWIPSFVEIEGADEGSVRSVAEKLQCDWSNAMHGSVETAYQAMFDVTDAELDDCPEIVFGLVPAWLEAKRRK